MIKAVIFDLDGVIFDTEHKRFADLRRLLKRRGYVLGDSRFKELLGRKSEVFVKDAFPECKKSFCREIASQRRELQYHNLKGGRLIKGIPELLRHIKLEGYKTALTTGSKKFIVERLLDMYLLRLYFDVLITGEDYTSSKPDPECYRVTLKKLGVKPQEALVIEDAANGIKAAKKLGCKVFGLKTYLSEKEFKGADRVFSTPKEILKYFKAKTI
jgi:HAD superfamily hydrolase (TIGR01509 family)